ncbi:MAG: NADPH-dependent 7-cyano-7-deazaguanine reductase QueF [Candidatus Margulisbacteria bacterium]|nr:NADPH-dependent 7-cyano-7-deazaguanine reductase QueF [Candidatus Margulisiibacteriota bacterium]
MPKAEGFQIPFESHDAIKPQLLETLPYQGETQRITYETREFTAMCPFSGLPDIGQITLEYTPHDHLVELKSLKYYLLSYRQVGIYQEDATNRIFKDLFSLLKPQHMKLTTVYNTRGGIDTTAVIEKSGPKSSLK